MSIKVRQVKGEGYKQLEIALKDLDGYVAKVGWFQGAKYPDKKSTPVAYVATIQEFGYEAKNIPPRPFMRPAIAHNEQAWKKAAEYGAKRVLKGTETVQQSMERIGLLAVGHIKKEIDSVWSPELKESTVRARLAKYKSNTKVSSDFEAGHSIRKPLIDTEHMRKTLTNTVERG